MNPRLFLRLGLVGLLAALLVWPVQSGVSAVTMVATTVPKGYVSFSDGACVVLIKPDNSGNTKIFVKRLDNDCVVLATHTSTNLAVKANSVEWLKPKEVTAVDVLLVGGGGNGGACSANNCGAGGGSGGQVRFAALNNLPPDSSGIVISPAARSGTSLSAGYSSTFFKGVWNVNLIALGGSNGAPSNCCISKIGGNSGWGAGGSSSLSTVSKRDTGPGKSNFAGGAGNSFGGGGGSGSGGDGASATSSAGGSGGIGIASDITGSLIRYAGGGGGVGLCTGCEGGRGVDGGGNGGSSTVGQVATTAPNLTDLDSVWSFAYGGGGGATRGSTASVSGSQGAVIWRFQNRIAPSWSDTTLGPMANCVAFSDQVLATGIPAPAYAVTSGQLPAGLSLNSITGAVSGTPTVSGSYSFIITATNSAGSISQPFSGTVGTCSDLQISVTSPGSNIVPGTQATITLSVLNNGPDTAPNAKVVYTLPSGVDVVNSPCGNAAVITCDFPSMIPNGVTQSWRIQVKIRGNSTSGLTSSGAASVTTTGYDPQLSNNSTDANFTIATASADLVIEQNGDTTFAPGATGKLVKLRMYNRGLSDATSAKIEFTLFGTHLTPRTVSIARGVGTCNSPSFFDPQINAFKVTCFHTGPMVPLDSSKLMSDPSQDVFDIEVTIDADNSPHGTSVRAESTVSSPTNDPVLQNNTSNVVLMFIDLRPDLSIRVNADPIVVVPGETATARIEVENGGSVSSDGPTTATITLPSGITATSFGVGCSEPIAGSVECTEPTGLAIGTTRTFTFTIKVSESSLGGTIFTLNGSVPAASTSVAGASGDETNMANNSANVEVRVGIPISDLVLSVDRPLSVKAGEVGSLTLTVVNNGPSAADGSSLIYAIPKLVTPSGVLPNGCLQNGARITCVRTSALLSGASISYAINVLVDVSAPTGLTVGGAMSVSTASFESSLSSNVATDLEANLDVVGVPVSVTNTLPLSLSVKVKAIPETGMNSRGGTMMALGLILAGFATLWRVRRRLA